MQAGYQRVHSSHFQMVDAIAKMVAAGIILSNHFIDEVGLQFLIEQRILAES